MQMDFLPNQQPDVVEYAADGQRERHIIPDGQHDPLGRVVLAVGRGYGHGAGHIKGDGHGVEMTVNARQKISHAFIKLERRMCLYFGLW